MEEAEAAAKNAKRALVLTTLAVAVAVIVLLIDQSIKNAILKEAQGMRVLLDEFRIVAKEATDGTTEAGETGSVPGPGEHSDHGVVRDPALGPAVDKAAGNGRAAPARGKAGVAGRPQGDG